MYAYTHMCVFKLQSVSERLGEVYESRVISLKNEMEARLASAHNEACLQIELAKKDAERQMSEAQRHVAEAQHQLNEIERERANTHRQGMEAQQQMMEAQRQMMEAQQQVAEAHRQMSDMQRHKETQRQAESQSTEGLNRERAAIFAKVQEEIRKYNAWRSKAEGVVQWINTNKAALRLPPTHPKMQEANDVVQTQPKELLFEDVIRNNSVASVNSAGTTTGVGNGNNYLAAENYPSGNLLATTGSATHPHEAVIHTHGAVTHTHEAATHGNVAGLPGFSTLDNYNESGEGQNSGAIFSTQLSRPPSRPNSPPIN